jgi:hypothetical protein
MEYPGLFSSSSVRHAAASSGAIDTEALSRDLAPLIGRPYLFPRAGSPVGGRFTEVPTMTTKTATPPATATGTLVVARYRDGRTVKGTTQDFVPARTRFHIFPYGDRSGRAVVVDYSELKAVFFVKSYDGNPDHDEEYSFERAKGHGRKAVVMFDDREMIAGYTMGYHPDRPGFFIVPAEPDSNNSRVFVINAAVKTIRNL